MTKKKPQTITVIHTLDPELQEALMLAAFAIPLTGYLIWSEVAEILTGVLSSAGELPGEIADKFKGGVKDLGKASLTGAIDILTLGNFSKDGGFDENF